MGLVIIIRRCPLIAFGFAALTSGLTGSILPSRPMKQDPAPLPGLSQLHRTASPLHALRGPPVIGRCDVCAIRIGHRHRSISPDFVYFFSTSSGAPLYIEAIFNCLYPHAVTSSRCQTAPAVRGAISRACSSIPLMRVIDQRAFRRFPIAESSLPQSAVAAECHRGCEDMLDHRCKHRQPSFYSVSGVPVLSRADSCARAFQPPSVYG